MNKTLLMLPACIALLSLGFSPNFNHSAGYPPAACVRTIPCDSIPLLNKKIINLVMQQIGKTVGRGECWDLAALVLNQSGAEWDKKFVYGRKVDPEKECVYPGDIIQFEGIKIKYTRERTVYTETMAHHTAVIYTVKSKGIFVIAHQNTGFSGRKVGLSELDLGTIIKGIYHIYRPVM